MCCITIFILFSTNVFVTIEVVLRLFAIFTWTKNFTIFSYPNSCDILLRNWFVDVVDISIIIFHRTNVFVTVEAILRLFTIFPWAQHMTVNRFPNCLNCINVFDVLQFKFWFIRVFLQFNCLSSFSWNWIKWFWCWSLWFFRQFWWFWVRTICNWFYRVW